ncbi:MAG: GNAT family N-acetyltransferase [Epsilonproteobacteria bacterium]|nr:GNAT family N-acetyltransferase [Campylobacterota bacterium]
MKVDIILNGTISEKEVVSLYKANAWSSANNPQALLAGLRNSHTLVVARAKGKLVGIANAISDGHLVVYYPHMLVDPTHQGRGIGREMMKAMQSVYHSFHQQMLTADSQAVAFYEAVGFQRAGETSSMWIYDGDEH